MFLAIAACYQAVRLWKSPSFENYDLERAINYMVMNQTNIKALG
jgi:hypothetical protein